MIFIWSWWIRGTPRTGCIAWRWMVTNFIEIVREPAVRAVAIILEKAAIELIGMLLTDVMKECRRVDLHLGIRIAGVPGK